MMKGAVMAAFLMATVLGTTALGAIPASADRLRPASAPIVETGSTARFAGGQWVQVRMGDVSLGVVWGTNATFHSGVTLFLDYTRYFGGAELYDEQGTYLGTAPLPLHSILAQHFDRAVEFRDTNNDSLFDLKIENRTVFVGDQPVKILDLDTAWYLDGPIEKVVTNDSAWVNFTVSASSIPYRAVYDEPLHLWRPAVTADGVLDKISLTFRLRASSQDRTLEVPFYRVTLASGNTRTPTASEFLGNRTISGRSRAVDAKYDQRIEGWDFLYADSKLAVATNLAFGNYINEPIVQWLQQQFGGACLKDGGFSQCESTSGGPTMPERINRTELDIAEGWQRAGNAYWTSNVTVDGRPATMTFEIYAAERLVRLDGAYASGVKAYGAFVYPQGRTIVHDPGLSATSVLPFISMTTNLAPSVLATLQFVVVGLALVPALLLRRRSKAPQGRP